VPPLPNPLGLSFEELTSRVRELGLPAFRAQQVFRAIHRERAATWDAIQVLSPQVRQTLTTAFDLRWPEVAERVQAADGTVRYLLRLADGEMIESVFIPVEDFEGGGETVRNRYTFCISTQVGCPVNCQFCLTALLGLKRNLEAAEIVGQVLTLLREHGLQAGVSGGDRVNVVYMGMGEPFLNYENVMRSVTVLTTPKGAALSPRRITISTSGVVDKIRRYAGEPIRPNLAISLNATTDESRTALMPLNRGQGGLAALFQAARDYPLGGREYLTFEYVLLAGVNDSPEDAQRILELTRGIACKVNLIAWNMGPNLPFASPSEEQVQAFQQVLIRGGLGAWVRRPRGREIYAACGQLKKTVTEGALPVLASL